MKKKKKMVKIDLITGFLGAGKTTFMKKYASYLIKQGLNIGILENDFGAVNVDMMLLQELEGAHCELEMIAGGCDAETHRRRFRTKLIAMGMCGYDRVLVEPSGIFDPDEFFDILRDEPLDQWYEIGNIIALVDAAAPGPESPEAEYLLASEAAPAGMVILSHGDEVPKEQAEAVVEHLNCALEKIRCPRRFGDDVLKKGIPSLSEKDLDRISSCGYRTESYEKRLTGGENGFETCCFLNPEKTGAALLEAVKEILESPDCGKVFRVKGFFRESDGSWRECNGTRNGIKVSSIENGQEVLIVIGESLNEAEIRQRLRSTIGTG